MKYYLLLLVLLIAACAQPISEVKNQDNIGEQVTVSGTVKNSIKIGPLSGYMLEDETGTIGIKSDELPKDGTKKTIRGTLIKDTIFGYYIQMD